MAKKPAAKQNNASAAAKKQAIAVKKATAAAASKAKALAKKAAAAVKAAAVKAAAAAKRNAKKKKKITPVTVAVAASPVIFNDPVTNDPIPVQPLIPPRPATPFLTGLSISAIGFNNLNFTRYLTASLLTNKQTTTGDQLIYWSFPASFPTFVTVYSGIQAIPSNIYPTLPVTDLSTGVNYISGAVAQASAIRTLYFQFSATTYDDSTTSYTLCTLPLSCTTVPISTERGFVPGSLDELYYTTINPEVYYITESATLNIIFDTFPDIGLNTFINYENADYTPYFYRLTDPTPYQAQIAFKSTTINLTSTPSVFTVNTTFNNVATAIRDLIPIQSIVRSSPTVSSVSIYVSALSGTSSFTPWYSAHAFQQTLSASFVPYFLSADFFGFTDTVFFNDTILPVNNSNFKTLSAGLSFVGEGHTSNVTLTAIEKPNVSYYKWTVNNFTHPISSLKYNTLTTNGNSVITTNLQVTAIVPTYPGEGVKLPLSLQTGDTTYFILSNNPPIRQYDDENGNPIYYPYYTSTVDALGTEITGNNIKQSLNIKPYDTSTYVLYPGIDSTIYLPVNNTPYSYESRYTNLTSTSQLRCFDINNMLTWTWNGLSSASVNNVNNLTYPLSTQTKAPSSWSMTQCLSTCDSVDLTSVIPATSGLFAKTIGYMQLPTNLSSIPSPVTLSAGGITWSLYTKEWIYPTVPFTNNATETFDFTLQHTSDILGITETGGKVSVYDNTEVNIKASRVIKAKIFDNNLAPGVTNDWLPRDISVSPVFSLTSIGLPHPRIYTPNRYNLTGTNILFENVYTNSELVTSIYIDFDNTTFLHLTSNPSVTGIPNNTVNQTFTVMSSTIGYKDINITSYTSYPGLPVVYSSFPNIIQTIAEYDTVVPEEYRSVKAPITLPWPNQISVGSNDWVTDNNINECFSKFYDNLQYLILLSKAYSDSYSDYFGYLSPVAYTNQTALTSKTAHPLWTWQKANCTLAQFKIGNDVTWQDAKIDGRFGSFSSWEEQFCTYTDKLPTLSSSVKFTVYSTLCSINPPGPVCNAGNWRVNIPGLDNNYENIYNGDYIDPNCIYTGIVSKNNNIYTALPTQIHLLSSSFTPTLYGVRNSLDGIKPFESIANISIDSNGKIFVLDINLCRVVTFITDENNNWNEFNNWGGFGFSSAKSKFNTPGDIHVDQLDNVWICDTGNNVVKQYSNTGTWLLTIKDEHLEAASPLSLAVDSQKNVHILTVNGIHIYSYTGVYISTYTYFEHTVSTSPRLLNASYNREIIYLALDTQVLKFFRNGIFAGYIIKSQPGVDNINGIFQDEYRNILITTNNIILKYADLMTLKPLAGTLPSYYWQLKDLLIDKNEYIQNWVYTKSFQRLWDNIEFLRNSIYYSEKVCGTYTPPMYDKSDMIVGQNEIVTSTVINRVLGYLWMNFSSLIKHFDPSCNY